MIEIIPAILVRMQDELERAVEAVHGLAPRVQVDVVDGAFAPHKSWPLTERESFEQLVSGETGLPRWDSLDFQFDLMLAHPAREAERFVRAGGTSLIVHAASEGAREALEALQPLRAGELPLECGVALLPDAPVSALASFDGLFDFVQVMGIAKVGSQGQPFDERATTLLAALRAAHPELPLQLDGGVTLERARALAAAGATRLVVGSAIFNSQDPQGAYRALYTEVNA